jgi:hypothetical protein
MLVLLQQVERLVLDVYPCSSAVASERVDDVCDLNITYLPKHSRKELNSFRSVGYLLLIKPANSAAHAVVLSIQLTVHAVAEIRNPLLVVLARV